MQEFSNLVGGSDLQATVKIPSHFKIIIPSEVMPEFGLLSVVVLSSEMGMAIYLF